MTFPYSNLESEETAGETVIDKSGLTRWQILGLWTGLGAIALFSFHCIGVLVFSVLGLSPGSNAKYSVFANITPVLSSC